MKHDFKSLVDRSNQASEKWLDMKRQLPEAESNIVPFSIADMEFKNPPEIIDDLIEFLKDDAVLGYTAPDSEYYAAVIHWMKTRHCWDVKPEWITVSNGIIPAIHDLVKAYAAENEGVILLTPVYYPFYSAIESNNRKVVSCPLIENGGYYEIDFDLLEELASKENNKMMIFCSPHNPVGRVWKKDELRKVGRICIRNNITIISDEIHFDLIMPGHKHTVMATLSDEFSENIVTCTAPSKTFNLAGMQTSNIIIKNEKLRRMFRREQQKSGFDLLNILGYKTCKSAYMKCGPWLDELIKLIAWNNKQLNSFMAERLPQVKVYPLEGTYLVWMDFRALGLDRNELEKFMVKEAHVIFDEGKIFGQEGEGFERMNIACPTDVMMEALERIAIAVKTMK